MPDIGEVRRAREIGKNGSSRFVWAACLDCGKERWVLATILGSPRNFRCGSCACKLTAPLKVKRREKHPNWKGGRYCSVAGYMEARVDRDSLFYPMTRSGDRVYEHRLVVAQSLGRCLESHEIVHHINGIRTDNRLENLCLIDSQKRHDTHTLMKQLQLKIRELEARIKKETD